MTKKFVLALLVWCALVCAAAAEKTDRAASLEKWFSAPAESGDAQIAADPEAMDRALSGAPQAAEAPGRPLSGLWAVGGHGYLGAIAFDGGAYRMYFDRQFIEQGTSVFHGDPWSGQPVRWTGQTVVDGVPVAEFSNVVQMIGPGQLAILFGSNPGLGPVIFKPISL